MKSYKNVLFVSFISMLALINNANSSEIKFYDQCPITKKPSTKAGESLSTVGILLAKSLIPVAIDWGAAALDEQGKEKNKSWSAKGSSYLYKTKLANGIGKVKSNSNFRCMVVALADTTHKNDDKYFKSDFYKAYGKISNSKKKQLPKKPLIYLEMAIKISSDNRFFKLAPRVLYYKKSRVSGWGNQQRDLSFVINFHKPNNTTPFGSTVISFENLLPGHYYNSKLQKNDIGDISSEWIEVAGLDDYEKEVIISYKNNYEAYIDLKEVADNKSKQISALAEAINAPYPPVDHNIELAIKNYCKQTKILDEESDHCPATTYLSQKHQAYELAKLEAITKLKELRNETPKQNTKPEGGVGEMGAFNASATITETRNASEFLKQLSKAVNSKKSDLSTELVNTLVPSARKTAELEVLASEIIAASDKDQLLIAALEARQNLTTAQTALNNAETNPETSIEILNNLKTSLLIAKIKTNTAYRNAGLKTVDITVPAISD